MIFWYIRFALEWSIWIIFADKKRWRELFPAGFMAGLYGTTTDIITYYYPLWKYDGDVSPIPRLVNTWGMYIVVVYLFLQYLPSKRSFGRILVYWFIWTSIAAAIEKIHVITGHMTYHLWWNMYCSYLADWVLFSIFYLYYKIFKFERMR
ncbi:MAG: hypothetical protein H6Q68_1649 [Firmicutes bacterium]|nr:hypothetical protein [Bacillota bacterium]